MKRVFKSDVLRLCVSLFVIAAVVSLALAGVNALTKDRIAALEGEAELETVRQFYDYDAIFEKLTLEDGTEYFAAYKPASSGEEAPETAETPSDDAAAETPSDETAAETPDTAETPEETPDTAETPEETPADGTETPETAPAADGEKGELLGYAVTVSENGYGGEIKMLVCFDKFGQVNGMGVISMSETSGVGTRITGEGFFDQFTGKAGPFKFVKGAASAKNDVVAITGASISSKAAVSAVNKAFTLLSDLFIEG